MELLPMEVELIPRIPMVAGNVDYQEFRQKLDRIDGLLEKSELEQNFIELYLAECVCEAQQDALAASKEFHGLSVKQQLRIQREAQQALRCNLGRELTGLSVRAFSARLADSPLLQKFCMLARMDVIHVPGKSTIDRYSRIISEAQMRTLISQLNVVAADTPSDARHRLDLKQEISLETYFLDCTCVKANIHFPVDWVLLRDAARSLIKSIKVIRRSGLTHRMPASEFCAS